MNDENEIKNKIIICMGSSCFSRGNNKNVEVINAFMKENNTRIKIEFSGTLCEDKCNKGPNIFINNKLYSAVDPNSLLELLNHVLVK
jgi:NADH:ubiquinone oxidoreductase subunit E